MIRICVPIAGILISVVPATASQLKVTVLDESNKGVLSNVLYYDGRKPTPFQLTNNNGIVEIPGSCQKISGFEAQPSESGTYFDSQVVPCANEVVIHLLTRDAPFGVAVKALQIQTTLVDGSPGIVTFKAGVVSQSKDVAANSCQVSLRTVIARQVYRVDGSKWSATQPDAAYLTAEGLSEPLPNMTTSLPSTCNDAKQRIATLKTSAEGQVVHDFGSGTRTATH